MEHEAVGKGVRFWDVGHWAGGEGDRALGREGGRIAGKGVTL